MKFCLWRKHQLAFAAGKTKTTTTFEWESYSLDYDTNVTFLKVLEYPSFSICYFWFEAIFFMHFIRFHFRLSPFFASVVVLHSVADRIVLFTVKVKVHLWFFVFSVFQFSFSHKVRFSCVLLAWGQYTLSSQCNN